MSKKSIFAKMRRDGTLVRVKDGGNSLTNLRVLISKSLPATRSASIAF
jgi:hypothetical protein